MSICVYCGDNQGKENFYYKVYLYKIISKKALLDNKVTFLKKEVYVPRCEICYKSTI